MKEGSAVMPEHISHLMAVKKQILVVDDEIINREILGTLLGDEYDVLYAADGQEALEQVQRHRDSLSLILLDLKMPVMSGMVVLKRLSEDAALSRIPAIVMTADQEAEVACLNLGASDFIPKPYPRRDIVLARVRRTIELSEDRKIILDTERDPLTGLYNREYFYSYAESFDQHHKHMPMDAIVVDVNHFHVLNERYGRAYADQVLKRIGGGLRDAVRESGGIVCRREADTFLVYGPHREDHQALLDGLTANLGDDGGPTSRIRLRMGVYPRVSKSVDMEQRFDRAKTAADAVRSNYSQNVSYYDEKLHEAELFSEQLVEAFDSAIRERQFKVYYQPKFDIRPDQPILASAEALIRWQHPRLGMISPGVFIPLFESNGMIQTLDKYVWTETAAQIRRWKEAYGIAVPVSVNVSRRDIFDPDLVSTFERLLRDNGLAPEELLLEITESAYTDDADLIISTVNALRDRGMKVEMDDFGTGYSSLGMLSHLPIDALKLDMTFVRSAFNGQGDGRMLELIIDMADYLKVPVIAEGVETREQLLALKAMGCDYVQGYYFSKPIPPEAFNVFVAEKKQALEARARADAQPRNRAPAPRGRVSVPQAPDSRTPDAPVVNDTSVTFGRIALALAQDYFTVYYVNADTHAYVEYSLEGVQHRLYPVAGGQDFFLDSAGQIPDRVAPTDRDRVAEAFAEKNLTRTLRENSSFSIRYQALVNGRPLYVSVKAMRLPDDPDHFIIGMSSIDAQVQREKAYEEALERSMTYTRLAQSLAADYFSIYYVDTETEHFSEFTAHDTYEDLGIEKEGEDFFALSRKNILRVIYPEDQGGFLQSFTRENVLREIQENGNYTITYRLMINGVPNYVSLKATAMKNDSRHIVIGVNNIDTHVQRHEEYEKTRQQNLTFSRIAQALSRDYYSIYLVNTENDEYIEYSSSAEFQELQIEQSGSNFFEECRRNVLRLVHPDDLKKALSVWEKDRLLREISDGKPFSVSYRLLFDGNPVHISCKVIQLTEDEVDQYMIIGVSNVDDQIRREQAYAMDLHQARSAALRDALTGVKSKLAFTEAEKEINENIEQCRQGAFAVAVCDVNGLKGVNDSQGHKAGDALIQEACTAICTLFKHSPVYRVGGDEFVAILQGQDYHRRAELLARFDAMNRENRERGGVVVACGLAEWNLLEDSTFEAVFERADAAMYENKKRLKA